MNFGTCVTYTTVGVKTDPCKNRLNGCSMLFLRYHTMSLPKRNPAQLIPNRELTLPAIDRMDKSHTTSLSWAKHGEEY